MKKPPDDSPLWDMLARWEQSARQGHEAYPEELCHDHPELVHDLKEAIAALRKTAWLDQPLGHMPKIADADASQTSFGDYELLGLLGEGGMGRVYKARHKLMDRVVAVKLLKRGAFAGADAVQRFQEEVRTAARLTHPNIVGAYDAGLADDGTPFLVMEFVDGMDLARQVRDQGLLAIEEAVRVIVQAATGLAHAHRQGILHLDVKPGNLLLRADRVVKLLDLGIARRQEDSPVSDEMLLGTVDYLAPEQTLQPRQWISGRTSTRWASSATSC